MVKVIYMNKKNKDIKILKNYIKKLGLILRFKPATRSSPSATWDTNKTITCYISSRTTKKQLILNILHEICHNYCDLAYKDSRMLYDALNTEDLRINKSYPKVDKSMRKMILDDETRAASFRQQIRKDLDLESVSQYDVELDVKLDLWIYRYYHIHGEFPTIEQSSKQKRKFKK